MFALAGGLLIIFLALFLIGLGPALAIAPARRIETAIAISPVAGFVETAVFGSYLTSADIPVKRWAVPFFVAASALSAVLILMRRRSFIMEDSGRGAMLIGTVGLIVTGLLLFAPQATGGLQFTVLRGNGTDAFNYLTEAVYLDREPFSLAGRLAPQTLANLNEHYEVVHSLLAERWTTAAVMAFVSHINSIPMYLFEYTFSLLCFLLAYGPVYCLAQMIGLRPRLAALTAVVVCSGFWAQLLIDIRAQAEMSALPILLLIVFLVAEFTETRAQPGTGSRVILLSLSCVALLFFYPEMVPTLALTLGIFFLICPGAILASRLGYASALILTVAGSIPLSKMIIRFATSQVMYAATGKNNWEQAWFPWFYANPLAGYWGFGPLERGPSALSAVTSAIATCFGAVLWLLLIAAIVYALRNGGGALLLVASGSLASFIEFGVLAYRGQLWAAGKALSFGYSLAILCLLGYVCFAMARNLNRFPAAALQFARVCGAGFLVIQAGLAAYRPVLAAQETEFPHYVGQHGDYRAYSWDISPIQAELADKRGVTVWLDIPDEWVEDYFEFALGSEVKLVNRGAPARLATLRAKDEDKVQPPQYVIFSNRASQFGGVFQGPDVVAKTKDFTMIRLGVGGAAVVGVENPNGIEGKFFWMGGAPTVLKLFSLANGCAMLAADAGLGPSSNVPYRTLLVGNQDQTRITVHGGPIQWAVRVQPGLNQIPISVKEPATLHLSTDPRPLLLSLSNLHAGSGSTAVPAGQVLCQ